MVRREKPSPRARAKGGGGGGGDFAQLRIRWTEKRKHVAALCPRKLLPRTDALARLDQAEGHSQ